MSFGLKVVASEDVPLHLLDKFDISTMPIIFRGCKTQQEVAKKFIEEVTESTRTIEKLLKTNESIIMSKEDWCKHRATLKCDFCKCDIRGGEKVRDHCHLSGKFRYTLCNKCNLDLQQPNFVPCFLHNLTNYDAHFIVTELGYDSKTISVIPNSEEKFISFSKYVSNTFTVRFIDTFRFMPSSLSNLAANLVTPNLTKFRETAKVFRPVDMSLVTRKGVYPYEYTDSWEKLDETSLPSMNNFYSSLTESNIDNTEYQHVLEVWKHFKCKTLGEYSDLYLKIDVLLLVDVFENFRDICLKAYCIDPAYYYTAPGMAFDCMLKKTAIKLELLTDYDMVLAFEKGIRGRLVQASMRYAKANHEKAPDFDSRKSNAWLVYQDCNNLYGWAMSEYMPFGDFKWVEPSLSGLDDLDDTSPIGRKKVPGFFSDETDGHTMTEFCALRAKSYAYKIIGKDERGDDKTHEKIKAKGIRGHVVKKHMTLEDHKKCLFGEDGVEVYKENVSIRSFKHQIKTIKSNKLTYNSYDDKRVVLADKINTLAHGHYSIDEDEPDDVWSELDSEVDAEGMKWSEQDKDLMRGLLHHTSNLS
ncbi:hypothetical protein QTP88_018643 [Uroleucon formosanum]